MTVTKKERIEFIDLAKGICIILVVMVHIIPSLTEKAEFLSCIRMPLYFCLSGLFFKDYGGYKNFTIKKINNILVPFIAWYVVSFIIGYAGFKLTHTTGEYDHDFLEVFYENDIANLPLWFLLCLFWSNLIFSFIVLVAKKWYYQLAGVLTVSAIGIAGNMFHIFNFLYIGTAFTCMPFFYMGYAFKRTTLLYPGTSKKKDFALMIICLAIGFFLAFYPDRPPRLNFYLNEVASGSYIAIYTCAALLVTGTLLLCKFIKKIPIVSYIGRYSIIVLVTHLLVNGVIYNIMELSTPFNLKSIGVQSILFLLNLATMLVVIPVCKKFLPHITAQKEIFKTSNFKKDSNSILKTTEAIVNNETVIS